MKILAFMLSIYILTIAVMPCEDGVDMAILENVTYTYLDDTSHDHSDDEKHNDCCSSFCLCQCCGNSIIIPSLDVFGEMHKTILYSYSFHYSSHYSFDYSNGVWHPPTLS